MTHFITDLNQAIIHQELDKFLKVPPLYTKLFPSVAPSNRGSERGRGKDINTKNRNGGESGGSGGSGRRSEGSNIRGDDNQNSSAHCVDSYHTKNKGPDKDKGILIVDTFPYSKCTTNPEGANHPPKVTVNGK